MTGETVSQAKVKSKMPGDNPKNAEICSNPDTEDDSPYSSVPLPNFSDEEQKTADNLAEWMKDITDPSRNIVKELQNNFGDLLTECEFEEKNGRPIATFIGDLDKEGKIHGDVELYDDNGDYFWGGYRHGVREGMGVIVLKDGDYYVGRFKDGYLDGFVTEVMQCRDNRNIKREVFYKMGTRHGFYREIGQNKQFLAVGRFVNGRKTGSHWCWTKGDSFLVGPVDEENRPDGDKMIFLYPDLTTTLCGHFCHGKMTEGRIVHLSGVRMEWGMPVPGVRESDNPVIFRYEQSGPSCISTSPMVRDLYEARYVYVAESGVPRAGEGLMAKTGIRSGQVCSLFNGVRQHQDDSVGWSDYRIACGEDMDLDIEKDWTSVGRYRATLAHKTQHSFSPNSHFAQFWHPRFGQIMSIVADRNIEQGEEIFVCYHYVMAKAPEWYQELWFKSGAWRMWSG